MGKSQDKEKKEEKKKPAKTLKEKRLEKKEKKGKIWFLSTVAFYYLHRGEPLPGFFIAAQERKDWEWNNIFSANALRKTSVKMFEKTAIPKFQITPTIQTSLNNKILPFRVSYTWTTLLRHTRR